MQYRCVATSASGFVQQIACSYLRHGYWYYVTGVIPKNKDPERVDAKLMEKYGIAVSESTRGRRKRLGKANLQYLRHGHFFVILATDGEHLFKEEEGERIRDIRRVPLKFHGYSIGYRRGGRTMMGEVDSKWHAHVEIERKCERPHAVGGVQNRIGRIRELWLGACTGQRNAVEVQERTDRSWDRGGR